MSQQQNPSPDVKPTDLGVTGPTPKPAVGAGVTVTYEGPSGLLIIEESGAEYPQGKPVTGVAQADADAVKVWCDENGHEVTLS